MFNRYQLATLLVTAMSALIGIYCLAQQPTATESQTKQENGNTSSVGKPMNLTDTQESEEFLNKVGKVMGYNICRNFKADNPDANFQQILEGIQAAASGKDRSSFVFGYQFYERLKKENADITPEHLAVGINLVIEEKGLGMTEKEIQELMTVFSQKMAQRQRDEFERTVNANRLAGQEYIKQQTAKNPNLKELKDGIFYEVLKEGSGDVAGPNSVVTFHYTGRFINGEVFDSSEKPLGGGPGEPSTLSVNGVVPGFSKSLQAMNEGARWRIIIPADQAYGERGSGGKIGPMETLVFELEIVKVVSRPGDAKN